MTFTEISDEDLRRLRLALSLLKPLPGLPTQTQVEAQGCELARLVRAVSTVADAVSFNQRSTIPSVNISDFAGILVDVFQEQIQPEIESAAEAAADLHRESADEDRD